MNRSGRAASSYAVTCQMCEGRGHSADKCVWVYSSCTLSKCNGIRMLKTRGKKYLECSSCRNHEWLDEVIASQVSNKIGRGKDLMGDCSKCGEIGHWQDTCPWINSRCIIKSSNGNKNMLTSNTAKNGRGKNFMDGCFKCGEIGHWQDRCPRITSRYITKNCNADKITHTSNIAKNGRGKNIVDGCFKCGEIGHWQDTCPWMNSRILLASNMAKNPEAKMEADRLSDLPNDILEQVLICLPLNEAVRTSVLSRQWRYRASMLPHLVFDNYCFKWGSSKGVPSGWEKEKIRRAKGCAIWKSVWDCRKLFLKGITFKLGRGNIIRFWDDTWVGPRSLKSEFPTLYTLSAKKTSSVLEFVCLFSEIYGWNLFLERTLVGEEIEEARSLFDKIAPFGFKSEEDMMIWREEGKKFSVKEIFQIIEDQEETIKNTAWADFPVGKVWRTIAPSKVSPPYDFLCMKKL